jgi:hypothetical protein
MKRKEKPQEDVQEYGTADKHSKGNVTAKDN